MKTVRELSDLLRVLQDPTRLRLLWGLRHGELSVGEIVQVTGLSQPRVSRHLRLLGDARVVRRTPDQNEVYYRAGIDDDLRGLVSAVLSCLPENDPVIDRDRQRLTALLDSRQARAQALLTRLGVCPLNASETADVSAAINELLDERMPPVSTDAELGEMLDIGTGTASMLRLLENRARRIVAVDLSRDMRLVARAAVLSAGLARCTVRQGDMYELEFQDGRFDLVTLDRVLGTAGDPALVLQEAARVMSDGGHLLVVEAAGALAGKARLTRLLRGAGLSPVGFRTAAQESALVALAGKAGGHARAPDQAKTDTSVNV